MMETPLARAAIALIEVAAGFHRRGWMLGTSGNLSLVLSPDPLRLAITASGGNAGSKGVRPARDPAVSEAKSPNETILDR